MHDDPMVYRNSRLSTAAIAQSMLLAHFVALDVGP